MTETLTSLQPYFFYGTIICLALLELVVPGRLSTGPVSRRWITNIGLFLIAVGLYWLLVPVSAMVLAESISRSGTGLLNIWALPVWADIVAGVLILDLWKYVEHRLVHRIPLLWRLHVVHHSDTDPDFTTTERHHPLEIVIGAGFLWLIVYLCGLSAVSIAVYLLLASPVTLISHANIRVGPGTDRALRRLVVTPAFHNVHHSAKKIETDSNFGVLFTFWDRLARTCRTPNAAEDSARVLGLEYFRTAKSGRLDQVLLQPFVQITESAERMRPDG